MAKTILLVEDEVAIANALQMVFEDKGYNVFIADNINLATLKITEADLIILDLMLPGGKKKFNGFTLLENVWDRLTDSQGVMIYSGFIDSAAQQAAFKELEQRKKKRIYKLLNKTGDLQEVVATVDDFFRQQLVSK
ncbi:MAG TPA: response regulator [Spirochaetota bacterium]|nr:response regulator [Spirochaetota bacterium]